MGSGKRERQRMVVLSLRLSQVGHLDRVGEGSGRWPALSSVVGVVSFANPEQDRGDDEVDQARDQKGNPFGPTEDVVGFELLEVDIHLLEDILSLEGDHAGFVFEFLDGVLELRFRDVFQNSLRVPSPVKDFRFRSRKNHRLLAINLMIFKTLHPAGTLIVVPLTISSWVWVAPQVLVASRSLLV